jgi:hypothetical protein
MWNVYLSKTKVHHEMTHSIHNVCRTLSCVHFKIKSISHAVRNIIPSNNGLGVEKIVMFLVTG